VVGALGVVLRGERLPNRFGLCAETDTKPKRFAPRTTGSGCARAYSLPR
jgi:hypothetical protein